MIDQSNVTNQPTETAIMAYHNYQETIDFTVEETVMYLDNMTEDGENAIPDSVIEKLTGKTDVTLDVNTIEYFVPIVRSAIEYVMEQLLLDGELTPSSDVLLDSVECDILNRLAT